MLVLSRKLNEQIRIGANVTITVLRVKGNAVRIGVEAPRNVRVVRGELPPKPDDASPAATRDDDAAACDDNRLDDTLQDDTSELVRFPEMPLKNRLHYYQTGVV
ncbi:MAG: carbon storage regulator CsrA [Pirellulaceae bacterium]